MATKKRGLGKGLDVLFGEQTATEASSKYTEASEKRALASGEMKVKISLVVPNADQPRKVFDKAALEELTASIKEYGVLDPLLVRKKGDTYEIIAGERRWRAAQAAGLKEVPVICREYTERQAAEIAIIENLQREDLNAIEEAQAYQQLIDEYELSQEDVANIVSKNRTTITNSLRLLKLAPELQKMLVDGVLSAGHARAILALEDLELQKKLANMIVESKMSVREAEKKAKSLTRKKADKKGKTDETDYSIFYKEYEEKLTEALGTKVHINRKDNKKGRIEIDYYSMSELERIVEKLV